MPGAVMKLDEPLVWSFLYAGDAAVDSGFQLVLIVGKVCQGDAPGEDQEFTALFRDHHRRLPCPVDQSGPVHIVGQLLAWRGIALSITS